MEVVNYITFTIAIVHVHGMDSEQYGQRKCRKVTGDICQFALPTLIC
jgi:hypothetical protein